MRIAFVKTLFEKAKKDKSVMLLTGDLGFSVFENFMQELPSQFLNAGVAEQNMTGMAAGMALEGRIPFIYSIVPFVTMRNFEQIRNDICYHNANVKIVGVGAGFSYAIYGYTHYALEDIAILRTLPNLTILAPGDPIEAQFAVEEAIKIKGPVYIRLGKAGEPNIHRDSSQLQLGKAAVVREGKDVTLIASSIMLARGFEVAEALAKKGISCRLLSMHTIKPLDEKSIIDSANKTKAIITLEEHTIIGGLGSAVSEVLAEHSVGIPFKRLAVKNEITKKMGDQEYMRNVFGLSSSQILQTIIEFLKNVSFPLD